MSENFIDRFCSIVREETDAPEHFIQTAGYHLISSTLGRFFYLPGTKGNLRLNIWAILTSCPGRFRRSSIQSLHRLAYYKIMEKYLRKLNPNMDEEETYKQIHASIIEEGSPEGIEDNIINTDLDTYTILSYEFGNMLSRIKSRTRYEFGVDALLSRLYYGESYKASFSRRRKDGEFERIIPPGLYVTMLVGMQELDRYLEDDWAFRQGLMRRITIVSMKPITEQEQEEIHRNWKPPIDLYRVEWKAQSKLEELAGDIAERMLTYKRLNESKGHDIIREYRSIRVYPVIFKDEITKEINKLAEREDREVLKHADVSTLYRQSLWEQLAKFSACHTIAEPEEEIREIKMEEPFPILVSVESFRIVKRYFEVILKELDKALPLLGVEKEKPRVVDEPLERLLMIIERWGGVISASALLAYSNLSKRDAVRYLETLMARGQVKAYRLQGSKGRPRTVFVTNDTEFNLFIQKHGFTPWTPGAKGRTYQEIVGGNLEYVW